jgi:uncharacterized protein
MLSQVVVKLNRACNLRCEYCYYINDRTPGLGLRMDWVMLLKFLDKYAAYCCQQRRRGTVVLHGGEPLLMGKAYIRQALAHHGFAEGHLRASMQTNGVLLDREWAELLSAHKVSTGVSLDGPPSVHDARRITPGGKGSYDLVVRGIRCLQGAGVDFMVLCVVDPSADGGTVFDHLVGLGIQKMDFLPPISNYARQAVAPVDLPGVEEYLARAFLAWVRLGDPRIEVRLFCEMIWRYMGKTKGYSAIGMERWDGLAVLETDGWFARIEELAEAEAVDGKRRYLTGVHVMRDRIEDAEGSLRLENAEIDCIDMPQSCKKCMMNDICRGGNIGTRIDANGSFDNPGIHCRAFYTLAAMIRKVVDEGVAQGFQKQRTSAPAQGGNKARGELVVLQNG